MASKSFVMIMAVVLITLLLYGINAVISMCFYNPINLKSPLQSVYLYYGSPFKLSIGQFLACYFPVKIISFILLGLFFMLICAALDNIIFVFVASAVTVVIEAICYTTISGTSFLAFLKYINIMYGVRTGRLFSDYVNINLFGYPLNTGVLYGLFWLVCIAVCILRLQIISIRCMKRSCFYCPALPAVKIQAAIHLYFCTNAIRHLFREKCYLF